MSRSMSHMKQEVDFVAGALSLAHEIQAMLDLPGKWTAEIRREMHDKVAALTGHMLVADFALTGDGDAVGNTIDEIHNEALFRLAA